MDYAFIARSLPVLLDAVGITVALAMIALLGSALGGLVVAGGRRSGLNRCGRLPPPLSR